MKEVRNILSEVRLDQRFDLYEVFHSVNSEYFDNKLVLNFEIKWVNTSSSHGSVKSTVRKDGRTDKIIWADVKELRLSKIYEDVSDDEFMNTFIHECIHILMLQNVDDYSWIGGYHGIEFMDIARDLNKRFGLKIDSKETSGKLRATFFNKPINILVGFSKGKFNGWVEASTKVEYNSDIPLHLKTKISDTRNCKWLRLNGFDEIRLYHSVNTEFWKSVKNRRQITAMTFEHIKKENQEKFFDSISKGKYSRIILKCN
jgi:hypothetical protein